MTKLHGYIIMVLFAVMIIVQAIIIIVPFADYIMLSIDSKGNDAFGSPIQVIHKKPMRYSDGAAISVWAQTCFVITIAAFVAVNVLVLHLALGKLKRGRNP
jgi:hypothetical protein